MPAVSLCMIVKNEEKNMERCLKSAAPFIDETIVVDTGSTDHTREICLRFGAKVYDFVWEDDFSKARNFGLECASNDWILWLDADEELSMKDFSLFQTLLQTETAFLFPVRMIHFYGEFPVTERRAYYSMAYRLFRKSRNIRFVGKVHEHLELSHLALPEQKDAPELITILHYGYLSDNLIKKSGRNLFLLQQEIAAGEEDPWLWYHFGVECHGFQRYKAALDAVNIAIIKFLKRNWMPPSLTYRLKYTILIEQKEFDAVYYGIDKAISLYPDYVDLQYYKGIAYYYRSLYQDAVLAFLHCLALGENNPQYLILSGTGSFSALAWMAACFEKLGFPQLADEIDAYASGLTPLTGMERELKKW